MGEHVSLQCSRDCGYLGAFLAVGTGFDSEREGRRCSNCGDLTDVLVARIHAGDRVPASGRGRCRSCGSQRLAAIADLDHLSCPNCEARLKSKSVAIWD
jgi:hypothetical protein